MKSEIIQIYKYLFLLHISICSGNIHTPLYRVIPPQNIFPKESEISVKGFQIQEPTSKNRVITLFETDLQGLSSYGYYMSVGVGSPPKYFNFVIDTGSSNSAVAGSHQDYLSSFFQSDLSSTFIDHKVAVRVVYDSGKWNGAYCSEIFTFKGIAYVDSNRTLKYSQPINVRSNFGLILQSKTFFVRNGNFQGILGLAYPILSQPNTGAEKSTLFDDIVSKYKLPNMFSIVLCGHNKSENKPKTSGHFIAGGVNASLFNPPMVDILIHRKWFYEIIISRISISNKPIILSSCKEYNRDKTILDTGTSDTYLPSFIFHSLISSILFNMNEPPFMINKNSPFWERKAVICILSTSKHHPAGYFPEIQFELVINDTASVEVALSSQQYIQYVGDQSDSFGNRRNCYKFGFGISKSGTILGDSFMEGFYFLFNRETHKVGIAQSKCNLQFSSVSRSRIIKINKGQLGLLACAVSNSNSRSLFDQLTPTITIIIGIIFALILIPSLAMLIYNRYSASVDEENSNLMTGSQTLYSSTK